MLVIETNALEVSQVIAKLNDAINKQAYGLLYDVGRVGRTKVQQRIRNQNEGTWPELSKWIRAKKASAKVPLEGADKFVKFKANGVQVIVYGDTGKEWTLSQHDEGFENDPHDKAWTGGDEFEIEIEDPAPLSLSGGTRRYKWKETGREIGPTPARQIWDTYPQASEWMLPIVSRWAEITVTDALK